MSVTINLDALPRQTFYSAPPNTTLNTVYTVQIAGVRKAMIDSINIASGSTGANATILINDGSNDFYLCNARAIGASAYLKEDFGQPILLPGYSIKVMSSLSNELDFIITIVEETF